MIGRRAIPLMLEGGHEVTAAGRDPKTLQPLERIGARIQTVDLFDPAAVRRVVEGAEAICNLATAVPPAGARMFLPGAWRVMDRVRREVSRNLVDAALAGLRWCARSGSPIGGCETRVGGRPATPRQSTDSERCSPARDAR